MSYPKDAPTVAIPVVRPRAELADDVLALGRHVSVASHQRRADRAARWALMTTLVPFGLLGGLAVVVALLTAFPGALLVGAP